MFWTHKLHTRELNLGLTRPAQVTHPTNTLSVLSGVWYRIPKEPEGHPISSSGRLVAAEGWYPRPGATPSGEQTNSAPYMYLAQQGWQGLEAPQFSPVVSSSVGGHGERIISNKGQGRRVTIPIHNPVGSDGYRQRKDYLDGIIYSGQPITITFRFNWKRSGTPDTRHLLQCVPVGEQTITDRHTKQYTHRISFFSPWPWFVGNPEWNPGAYSNDAIQPMIHGIDFRDVSTSTARTINWGGASFSFTPSASSMVWTPSPPFQNWVSTTGQFLQPYDNTDGTAFTRSVSGLHSGLTPLYTAPKTYGSGELRSSKSPNINGAVPFRLRNYASL